MKLYLLEDNFPWQPQRYRYSVEQMMLMLFPGEKPEYPDTAPSERVGADPDSAIFTLHRGAKLTNISALVTWGGRWQNGVTRIKSELLDEAPEQVYHTVQHALKMAFYKAGTAILGYEPPWGALTGVRPVKLPTKAMKNGASPEQAREELEREYRVSPVRAQLALDCAQASLAVDRSLNGNEVSLYIGVPFCPTRCAYCSFVSADVGRTLKLVEPYLEAVFTEIDETAKVLKEAGLTVRSLYMGGGTPTTLTAGQIDRLLTRCEEVLPLAGCTEYTVEAGRPDTITREKLEVLARHNIGRISINPQTLEDDVLAAIGRKHSAADIVKAYGLAREVGFQCINMDLIAGLPRDTYEGFCRSLEGVLAMDPENVTVHTLALKKGSTLMNSLGAPGKGGALVGERTSGKMSELSHLRGSERYGAREDDVARMLEFSLNTLRGTGYVPYYLYRQKYMSGSLENVGWTKPGLDSLYNIVMMEELQTVVSIGGGGVTKLVAPKAGKILRLPNPKYPHDYLATLDKVLDQKQEIINFYAR